MSDSIYKIIPTDCRSKIDNYILSQVLQYLKMFIKADDYSAHLYDTLSFIDCGANLERITCPNCGKEVSFDWWGHAMDYAYRSKMDDLAIRMPCCGDDSFLNNLIYDAPCGFAFFEIDILNPVCPISVHHLNTISKIIGKNITVVTSHL